MHARLAKESSSLERFAPDNLTPERYAPNMLAKERLALERFTLAERADRKVLPKYPTSSKCVPLYRNELGSPRAVIV